LGFDFGFTLVFNQYVKVGFAINDLGFIIFPKVSKKITDGEITIADMSDTIKGDGSITDNIAAVFKIKDAKAAMDIFLSSDPKSETFAMISPISMRTGVSITPVYSRYFDFILAADISISDFYKIVFKGYPTFAIATGFEFAPKVGWFRMPIIAAFNFNTESLGPSFSFGIGLHLGAAKMMIGVKGLEGLIQGYGSNDMAFGFDFKFEF